MLTSGMYAKFLNLFLPLVLQLSTPILREISAAPLPLYTSPHTYVKRVSQRFNAKIKLALKKATDVSVNSKCQFLS